MMNGDSRHIKGRSKITRNSKMDRSLPSKIESQRSITEEYLQLTGKKKRGDSDSIRNLETGAFNIPANRATNETCTSGNKTRRDSNSRSFFSGDAAYNSDQQRDPFLHHIMKQINFLKVENLELKKLVCDKVSSGNHSDDRSRNVGRRRISFDERCMGSLEPIASQRVLK